MPVQKARRCASPQWPLASAHILTTFAAVRSRLSIRRYRWRHFSSRITWAVTQWRATWWSIIVSSAGCLLSIFPRSSDFTVTIRTSHRPMLQEWHRLILLFLCGSSKEASLDLLKEMLVSLRISTWLRGHVRSETYGSYDWSWRDDLLLTTGLYWNKRFM